MKLKSIKTFAFLTGIFVFQLSGLSQWATDLTLNTPVCNLSGSQRDARIIEDGAGGAFIVWRDSRAGSPDIYVQRMSSAGVPLWTINGIGACTNFSDQSTPSLVSDMAGGIIVTWSDWRSGIERDIYAQRIDGNGNMLWTIDGAIVTDKTEREHNERIISDDAGGCIIAWEQQNSSTWTWEIWAQRLNSNGVRMWGNGGVSICTNTSNKRNPKLQRDRNNGGFITWQDLRNGFEYDIYAQRISSGGTLLWGSTGLAICNASNDQTNPKIDPDTITNGIYVAWADERNPGNSHDIYCQRVDANGNFMWTANGVAVCTTTGGQTAVDILAEAYIDGVFLTWKDSRNGNSDIYAQRLNAAGVPQWTTNGLPVCNSSLDQRNPNICYNESGGAIIVWEDSTQTTLNDIKAQRINASGGMLWLNNGVVVSNNAAMQKAPKSVSDKNGGVIVVWDDYRQSVSQRDVYAQRLDENGNPIGISENEKFKSSVSVFPNPFEDQFIIEFDSFVSGEVNYVLTDLNGREVLKGTVNTNASSSPEFPVLTQELDKGIYLLNLSWKNNAATVKLAKY